MIIIHMFFQSCYTICFIICYKSFSFFCVRIKIMDMTIVIKQTCHDLRTSKINFFVIIHKIKSSTNCSPIMAFPYFPLCMQCLKVPFHFIMFIKICYFVYYALFYLKALIEISSFIFHSFKPISFSPSMKCSSFWKCDI